MFGITSPWKAKFEAAQAENRLLAAQNESLSMEKMHLGALLQVVENERDQLNEMVTDLHYHLDEARATAASAALMLSEIASEALEGNDFPTHDLDEEDIVSDE